MEKMSTPLQSSSIRGELDMVRLVLDQGADIEEEDFHGRTPLMLACLPSHSGTARLLLDRGAKTEHQDKIGRTALFWSVRDMGLWNTTRKEIVQLLIEHGANTNHRDIDGITPLLLMTKLLPCVWPWPIDYVKKMEDQREIARLLLCGGANTEVEDNGDGSTPLIAATISSCFEVVKLLLEHGANIDHRDNHGKTSLYHVAEMDHEDIVNLLIHGTAQRATKVARLLLCRGANTELKDNHDRRTPLIAATISSCFEKVQALLEHGANIDHRDNYGKTSLYYAAEKGHQDMVYLLVQAAAQKTTFDEIKQMLV